MLVDEQHVHQSMGKPGIRDTRDATGSSCTVGCLKLHSLGKVPSRTGGPVTLLKQSLLLRFWCMPGS